jgi:preprotein translocase subunit SecG
MVIIMKYKTIILVFVFCVCSVIIIGNKKEKETKDEKTNNEVRAVYVS